MAANQGTIVVAPIRPVDSEDTYPSALQSEIKGGFHSVETALDRDSIPSQRLLEGMLCYVKDDGKTYQYEDSIWKEYEGASSSVLQELSALEDIHIDTREPTGIVETNTNSTLSIDEVTRVVTIAPNSTLEVYVRGDKRAYLDPESVVIDDIEGNHFVVFDTNGDLLSEHVSTFVNYNSTLDYILKDNAFVAEIYWDATNKLALLFDERHGLMPWQTHLHQHLNNGAFYLDGLGVGDVNADASGDLDSSATFSISAGKIQDEDRVDNILTKLVNDDILTLYKSGSNWRWGLSPSGLLNVGLNGAGYNLNTGGVWSLEPVPTNSFFCLHIYATNELLYGGLAAVTGQAVYNTIADARTAASTEIGSINTEGLPTPEFVAICTFILEKRSTYNNTWKTRIRTTDEGGDYLFWIGASIAGRSTANDHGALSGLGDDDHIQYFNEARGDARYSQIGHTHEIFEVEGLQTELDSKQPLNSNLSGIAGLTLENGDFITFSGGALSARPLQSTDLPAIAITTTSVVASEVEMLALSVQTGDVAVRTDLNKTFILTTDDPTQLSNWQEMLTPTDSVQSVDGRVGVVTLSDLYAPISHSHLASEVTDFSEAVDDRVASLLIAGTNISLTYDDASNTLTIAATGTASGVVSDTFLVIDNDDSGPILDPTYGTLVQDYDEAIS